MGSKRKQRKESKEKSKSAKKTERRKMIEGELIIEINKMYLGCKESLGIMEIGNNTVIKIHRVLNKIKTCDLTHILDSARQINAVLQFERRVMETEFTPEEALTLYISSLRYLFENFYEAKKQLRTSSYGDDIMVATK